MCIGDFSLFQTSVFCYSYFLPVIIVPYVHEETTTEKVLLHKCADRAGFRVPTRTLLNSHIPQKKYRAVVSPAATVTNVIVKVVEVPCGKYRKLTCQFFLCRTSGKWKRVSAS